MALDTYREKRNFRSSPEPQGGTIPAKAGHLFVIQKHDARRLHYDFRLEMDGVLKSWAVTRGPSLDPNEKRLAVHVEDHPLDYGAFEGTIPKGEYGGGTVVLWDRGQWTPIGDAAKGYAKGHLDFELDGEKLHGRWHLVRMAPRRGEKRDNWLLIKGDDAVARPVAEGDILDEQPLSVKTGRSVDEIAGEEPGWSSKTGKIERKKAPRRSASPKGKQDPGPVQAMDAQRPETINRDPAAVKKARKAALPDFVEPCLATLVSKPPKGKRWIHEIKFDGYRIQARLDAGKVTLLTRTGLDWTARFGDPIVKALKALPADRALIDGEIVVETGNGPSDFSALQADLTEGRSDRFKYYAFDLLHLDGHDLTPSPLSARKTALETALSSATGPLQFSGQFDEDGELILKHACRLSLEGVVSKLRDAPYHQGRNKDWVKSKCSRRQEFVIGGFTPSSTTRHAIGSLLLGTHDGEDLKPVGRVGTGFTMAVAADLHRRLDRLRRSDSPFAQRLTADEARGALFVEPHLVAEVEFRSWTADHHLRHASFRGLREDKSAAEVVREESGAESPAQRKPKTTVRLTHPDRVYWPDAGVTKEGLASYYADVWRFMAPFVVNRPLSLVRCPGGITQQCFFQKHAWKGIGPAIRQTRDPHDTAAEPLLTINDLDGMITLVQAGVLEIHPWGSTLAALERPDMIILDLDPGEDVDWAAVVSAAHEVRDRLEGLGLNSFVKTSGGKGLHVVAPLKPVADWTTAKAFTKSLAEAMTADSPDRYVAVVTKSKRKNKILIDYLRNGRGATAVACYSTRARPGASVSMPLDWAELGRGLTPSSFTVDNTPTRLAHLSSDPWGDFMSAAAPLPADTKSRKGSRTMRSSTD